MTASTGPARTLLVSAIASGQGKTSVTAALARRLVRAGQRVRVFMTGPDFLDPTMLAQACGAPVQTLDLWMGRCPRRSWNLRRRCVTRYAANFGSST